MNNKEEQRHLLTAAYIIRVYSNYHNDAFQRTRDSTSLIEQYKGRASMEKAIELSRIANEVETVARTEGFKDGK